MLPPRYANALTYAPRMIRPSRYPTNALSAAMPSAAGGTMGGIGAAAPQAAPQGSPEAAAQAQQGAVDQYGFDGQGTFTETSLGPNPGKAETMDDLMNGPGAVVEALLGGPISMAALAGRIGYSAARGYDNLLSTRATITDIGAQLGLAGRGTGPGMGTEKPEAAATSAVMGFGPSKGTYGNRSDYVGTSDGIGGDGANQGQNATGGNGDGGGGYGPGSTGETEGGNQGGNASSFRTGGYTGHDGDGMLEPMSATLHEGEFVLRPEAVAMFGRPMLEAMNRGDGNALMAAFAQRPPVTSWMQGAPIYPNDPPTTMPELMPEGPGQREWQIPPSPTWFTNALRDLRRI